MMYYSPNNNSFYPYDMKEDYGNSWPEDAVKVSEEDWQEFGQGFIPEGKVRGWMDGKISWVDKSTIESKDQIESRERVWRNSELNLADIELNKVQDSDPKSVGSVSLWREYRKELRFWPENADFPDMTKRPVSPKSLK